MTPVCREKYLCFLRTHEILSQQGKGNTYPSSLIPMMRRVSPSLAVAPGVTSTDTIFPDIEALERD
jgi:hypothetical protein